MKVKLQNVYQVTRDMDRALGFYRDVLGMTLKFRDAGKWSQLQAAGSNVALSSPEEAAAGATGTVMVLEVEDLDEAREQLEAAGTSVVELREVTHGRTLTCRDPDGNLLQIFARKAPKPAS